MASRNHAVSARTKYRHAREHLAALEAERARVERSRPRTRGKKAARTRALNTLSRTLRAARGLVTKTRAIATADRRAKAATKRAAAEKRREAARKGWRTRRAPQQPAPSDVMSRRPIPHLTPHGVQSVWPPSREDRGKEGSYWNEVDSLLSNRPASFARFEGDSIYDEISGQRLPFVTDIGTIFAYSDYYHYGDAFYRDRHGSRPFAA